MAGEPDRWRPEHLQERAEREAEARHAVLIEAYCRRSDERLRERARYIETHPVWGGACGDVCQACGRTRMEIHFWMLRCEPAKGAADDGR